MAELAALGTYLADLRMRGKLVPVRGGKPNRSAIAKVCGFSRNAFYVNPELAALLDGDNHRKSVDAFESHRAALVRYCASLRADELELPMFCGKPNLSAIAMAAGIPRNAFYNLPDLATTLTSFAL